MKGYVTFGETDYDRGADRSRPGCVYFMFDLTIRIENMDNFLDLPEHEAPADGRVQCETLGGQCRVEKGVFNLFVDVTRPAERRMLYRLFLRDAAGKPITMSGFKAIKDDGIDHGWRDTTTLYTRLYAGHVSAPEEAGAEILAAGILIIRKMDFIHQLTTFRVGGPTLPARASGARRFGQFFLGSLWDVYGIHTFPDFNLERQFAREIPFYTTEGVRDAEVSVHSFATGDKLGLSLQRFLRRPSDDVVVLAHGLTASTDMFIMPEHDNLVTYLLDHGYTDVWGLDFRMSNRHPYNLAPHHFNMDDIALYDFPAALALVRRHVGDRPIHVICHCLGSLSFMMSLFGGSVHGISSVVSNSVALTPILPGWSATKAWFAPFTAKYVFGFPYLSPSWAYEPGLTRGKIFSKVVSFFHRECDVAACHMLSLMWGTGRPAMWEHENLQDITHRRCGDLFGGTSMNYYRHLRKMNDANHTAVKFLPHDARYASLPDDYLDHAAEIETPVLLMTGDRNRVFQVQANVECHRRLELLAPGRHVLQVVEGFGHQDMFMGRDCASRVFPYIVSFLERHRGRRVAA
jgi:cholesterol oxidase